MRALLMTIGAVLLALAMTFWLGGGEATPTPPAASGEVVGAAPIPQKAPSDEAERQRTAAPTYPVLKGKLLQNGQPLAGVAVIACRGLVWRPSVVHRTETANDGTFELPNQALAFWLTADGPQVPRNYKTEHANAWLGVREFDVPVPGAIEGVVKNREGAVVADAKVTMVAPSYERINFEDAAEVAVTSDAQGRFRFDRVGAHHGDLYCEAEGYAVSKHNMVEVAAGATATMEIVLNRGRTLRGLVTDHQGRALAGAKVLTGDGQRAETDALGQFAIAQFRAGASLKITAKGHLEFRDSFVYGREQLRVRLERAVTLRGKVIGSLGKPGMVYLSHAANERPDASKRMSAAAYEWLQIVRDGEFVIEGLAMSDFEVTVRVPGVGAVGPVRVEMRDDREVEFALQPQQELTVSVLDADGRPVPGATLVRDDGILTYDSLYRGEQDELQKRIRGSHKKLPPIPADQGDVALGVPPGESVAFLVSAPGFLDVAHAMFKGAIEQQHAIVLERAGSIRGNVSGLRAGYDTLITVVPVGDPAERRESETPIPDYFEAPGTNGIRAAYGARVDPAGTFAIDKVKPGAYRAYLSRSNRATAGKKSSGLPLIDEWVDKRSEQSFEVVAGEVAQLAFEEQTLGRLRGRVLMRGVPVADVKIVASRPRPKQKASSEQDRYVEEQGQFVDLWAGGDWDGFLLEVTAGRVTGSDGAYEFAYRDAGSVEVRVRHPQAAVTSAPFVIDLPPPGDDVVRDIELPLGEIRGRYPVALLSAAHRESATATLYPMNKTLHDPFYDTDYVSSLSSDCTTLKGDAVGDFSFTFLRPGPWLVRIHHNTKDGFVLAWQKVIEVRGDVVDVGDIPLVQPVASTVKWKWQGERPGKANGIWLRSTRDGGSPIWVATLPVPYRKQGEAPVRVAPGSYIAVPFGYFGYFGDDVGWSLSGVHGVSGLPLGKPAPIEIRSDGSVLPKVLEFSPLPAPSKKTGHK